MLIEEQVREHVEEMASIVQLHTELMVLNRKEFRNMNCNVIASIGFRDYDARLDQKLSIKLQVWFDSKKQSLRMSMSGWLDDERLTNTDEICLGHVNNIVDDFILKGLEEHRHERLHV